jgi:hypothetical protein
LIVIFGGIAVFCYISYLRGKIYDLEEKISIENKVYNLLRLSKNEI